jgi:glycosyltransferase involved in cell wall biosynthesis
MTPSRISIVIPAYNEGKAIFTVVTDLRDRFPDAEVLVVNDASTDDTAKLAQQAGARVLHHSRNTGYGSALRTGTEASSRDYVLFYDGDGQHRVEDAATLIGTVDEYDVVIGERDEKSHVPISRRPGKLVIKWLANYLAGENIPDINSGLRIFKRDVLLKYIHLMPEGFSFSTTSTLVMFKTRRRIKYVPIHVSERIGVSTVRQVRHGFETLMLILRITMLFEPLKVFLGFTGLMALFTAASIGVDLFNASSGLGDTSVLLAISTLLIFLVGLLSDQVSAIRRQLHE